MIKLGSLQSQQLDRHGFNKAVKTLRDDDDDVYLWAANIYRVVSWSL